MYFRWNPFFGLDQILTLTGMKIWRFLWTYSYLMELMSRVRIHLSCINLTFVDIWLLQYRMCHFLLRKWEEQRKLWRVKTAVKFSLSLLQHEAKYHHSEYLNLENGSGRHEVLYPVQIYGGRALSLLRERRWILGGSICFEIQEWSALLARKPGGSRAFFELFLVYRGNDYYWRITSGSCFGFEISSNAFHLNLRRFLFLVRY